MVAAILGSGVARADAPIEGVWSFNGGQVAIQENADGTFTGTVVKATKFTLCLHPVGEQIWTGIVGRPDGSYWGLHQWYLGGIGNVECSLNPELGPTAWRVLSDAPGSSFLRVCFSAPGSNEQPTIAADGTAADDNAGCSDSSLVSSVPEVTSSTAGQYIQLPSSAVCLRKKLKVVLKDPVGSPIAASKAYVKSGKVKREVKFKRHGNRLVANFDLSGLPGPKIKVVVSFRTVLGQKVTRTRSYTTICKAKKKHRPRHHGSASGR